MFHQLFDSTRLFGGVPLFVLMGDFRQTAPIFPDSCENRSIYASIKMSHLWSHVKEFTLTRNFRQTDAQYMQQLQRIGDGTSAQDPNTTNDEFLGTMLPFQPLPLLIGFDSSVAYASAVRASSPRAFAQLDNKSN